MKLYIKYMASIRCKMAVKEQLKRLKIAYLYVDIGMIEMLEILTKKKREQLGESMRMIGLVLLDEKDNLLMEKTMHLIVETVHYSDVLTALDYPEYIATKLHCNYDYLSALFQDVMAMTIGQCITLHKIERVKEMLIYDKLSPVVIADVLHYRSARHLSTEFKRVSGLPLSFFKALRHKKRKILKSK